MKYQYWLLCLQGVGNLCKRQLIACFGSAKDLYLASEEKLAACRFLKEREREMNLFHSQFSCGLIESVKNAGNLIAPADFQHILIKSFILTFFQIFFPENHCSGVKAAHPLHLLEKGTAAEPAVSYGNDLPVQKIIFCVFIFHGIEDKSVLVIFL